MLYDFTDISAKRSRISDLPAEAMSINGVFLENVIDGYRTLAVSGRESIKADITKIEKIRVSGDIYQYRRYPSRTLTVTYQLIADSPEQFRKSYNDLNAFLNVENAQLIFNDELDKYFVGTPTQIGSVDPGKLAVIGEIAIECQDPFKYDVRETEVQPKDGEFIVDYPGSVFCYPTFTAAVKSDLGFMSFVKDTGAVLQIGDPLETNYGYKQYSKALYTHDFKKHGFDKNNWVMNRAPYDTLLHYHPFVGHIAESSDGIYADNYGDRSHYTYYHGPSITHTLSEPAENFTFRYTLKHSKNSVKTQKESAAIISGETSSGKTISLMEIHVYDVSDGNFNSAILYYVNKSCIKTTNISGKANNGYTTGNGYLEMRKFGNEFTFSVNGKNIIQVTFDDLSSVKATAISFVFGSNMEDWENTGYNDIGYCSFISHRAQKWEDVTNKFMADDQVNVDCSQGLIAVNGSVQYGLGALGNDWEDFTLTPGINHIKIAYSSWADSPPEFTLKYRGRYI